MWTDLYVELVRACADRVHHCGLSAVGQSEHRVAPRGARVDVDDGHGAVGVVDGLQHGAGELGRGHLGPRAALLAEHVQQVLAPVVLVAAAF